MKNTLLLQVALVLISLSSCIPKMEKADDSTNDILRMNANSDEINSQLSKTSAGQSNTSIDQPNLFGLSDNNKIIEMTIKSDFPYRSFNFGNLTKNIPIPSPEIKYNAELSYKIDGESHTAKAKIKVRGGGRRSFCDFTPFKIKINEPSGLFTDVSDWLKVVTHCYEGSSQDASYASEMVLKEYLAYKTLEVMNSEPHLKVQIARIKYLDSNGLEIAHELGFFIEPMENLANRLNLKNKVFEKEIYKTVLGDIQPDFKNSVALSKMNRAVDIENLIHNELEKSFLLDSDRRMDFPDSLDTYNKKAILTDSGRIKRINYDFNGGYLGQRSYFNITSSEYINRNPMFYSMSLESIRYNSVDDYFKAFCSKTIEKANLDFLNNSEKIDECSKIFSQYKSNNSRTKIKDVVDSFELLTAQQKIQFYNRINEFYEFIDGFSVN